MWSPLWANHGSGILTSGAVTKVDFQRWGRTDPEFSVRESCRAHMGFEATTPALPDTLWYAGLCWPPSVWNVCSLGLVLGACPGLETESRAQVHNPCLGAWWSLVYFQKCWRMDRDPIVLKPCLVHMGSKRTVSASPNALWHLCQLGIDTTCTTRLLSWSGLGTTSHFRGARVLLDGPCAA